MSGVGSPDLPSSPEQSLHLADIASWRSNVEIVRARFASYLEAHDLNNEYPGLCVALHPTEGIVAVGEYDEITSKVYDRSLPLSQVYLHQPSNPGV